MIDNDQQIDLVTETVRRLLDLGTDANADAAASVDRLAEEVSLRQPPNVHRYELLARQQHIALLAPTVAAAIEETGFYHLTLVAERATSTYVLQHTDGDLFGRAVRHAADRILDTVAEVLHAAQQAQTDREVEQHEADLADRDAGFEL